MFALPDADLPSKERTAELAAVFREIDRRWAGRRERRFLRAVAAYNHGDAMGWHRELQVGLAEMADDLGIPRDELTRVVLPAREQLLRRTRGRN